MILEKFETHDNLNPVLWDADDKLRPEVREKLLATVDEFLKNLEFGLDVVDVHIVGSNASFNYTAHSDVDVHLIANFGDDCTEVLKYACAVSTASFNKSYDVEIKGIKVELYVEDIRSTTVTNGIYSLYEDKWVKFPKKIIAKEYDISSLYADWEKMVTDALNNKGSNSADALLDRIYIVRKNSIDIDGEYGKGNQLFKELRNAGLIQKLKDKVKEDASKRLSIESLLTEDTRAKLIGQSKSSKKGMQRFNRRVKSRVATTVKQYNSIDMNKLFKDDILTININVNGETDDYIVRIKFGGFLDILYNELNHLNGVLDLRTIIRALIKGFNQDDVYIHCSCPDARYRFAYWQTVKDINSGDPENRPSNITNPDNTLGSGCKHVLLVLNNNSWLIKVASVINNYIKYMSKNYEKLYADIIYPAIYRKPYSDAVQLDVFGDKELAGEKDSDEISTAIDYGKKSTQFQKGNTSGVRFAAKDSDGQQETVLDDEE